VSLPALIASRIERDGPITAAEFIDLALYHPEHGYYATVAQRSGRAGDFYTSVDVGPLYGELVAGALVEMWDLMGRPARFDLVEAAAGNGRLARDVLDAALAESPDFHTTVRLHLVETSAPARAAQRHTLGPHADRLASSGTDLPASIEGVVVANELLDALPPHAVAMHEDGLRERRVGVRDGAFVEVEGLPSTPEIAAYLARVGAALEPGRRAEVNLAAERWVVTAARRLTRGFLMIVDYGHEAAELYSASHAAGTLTTFSGHAIDPAPDAWLRDPGGRDITSHVDLTGVRLAAGREGLETSAAVDQTYFLLALGAAERLATSGQDVAGLKRRLALKTLLLPGGLGSTHKVLIFARGVDGRRLRVARAGGRLT
jgi:SAM-dependent MidA family methyltransferase